MEVLTIAKLDHQLNEEIRDKEIRLIGADGAQLGIMSSAQANAMAEEQGMDLVKISPNATPPVCKIMDYSKFCFDQKKREKEAKKNQRVVEIKEIRMSPSIDTNDFNTKVKAQPRYTRLRKENLPMPKLKTHSGAKKRFNLTKTGKVKRARAYKSHILTKKTTKRTRHLRATAYADMTNVDAIKKMIPYK